MLAESSERSSRTSRLETQSERLRVDFMRCSSKKRYDEGWPAAPPQSGENHNNRRNCAGEVSRGLLRSIAAGWHDMTPGETVCAARESYSNFINHALSFLCGRAQSLTRSHTARGWALCRRRVSGFRSNRHRRIGLLLKGAKT